MLHAGIVHKMFLQAIEDKISGEQNLLTVNGAATEQTANCRRFLHKFVFMYLHFSIREDLLTFVQ